MSKYQKAASEINITIDAGGALTIDGDGPSLTVDDSGPALTIDIGSVLMTSKGRLLYGGWSTDKQAWLGTDGQAAITPDLQLVRAACNLANAGYGTDADGRPYWQVKIIGKDYLPIDIATLDDEGVE